MPPLNGTSTPSEPGVSGSSDSSFAGVRGSNNGTGVGVRGFADNNDGIRGDSKDGGAGVRGNASGSNHVGVVGESFNSGNGVLGKAANGCGVWAISQAAGHGVYAEAHSGDGQRIDGGTEALAARGAGVLGIGVGVSVMGLINQGGWHEDSGFPKAPYSIGVCGAFSTTFDPNNSSEYQAPLPWDIPFVNSSFSGQPHYGVYGLANVGVVAATPFADGVGLVAVNTSTSPNAKAATFGGHVSISGNCAISGNFSAPGQDCAEKFDVAASVHAEPGSLLVMDNTGLLVPCDRACDPRVIGVVSGAGDHVPGLVLGDNGPSDRPQAAIALIGRVGCKVDASFGAIAASDLLTTSPTYGHAMKVADPASAAGSIIGKALQPLGTGTGTISILVMLK